MKLGYNLFQNKRLLESKTIQKFFHFKNKNEYKKKKIFIFYNIKTILFISLITAKLPIRRTSLACI